MKEIQRMELSRTSYKRNENQMTSRTKSTSPSACVENSLSDNAAMNTSSIGMRRQMSKTFTKTKVVEWCALRDLNVESQRIFGRLFNAIFQMNGRMTILL